MTLKALF